MDLTNVKILKVDIADAKPIAYFRRNGPLTNVAIPKSEYTFMAANGFKLKVRQLIMIDGSVVDIKDDQEEQVEEALVQEPAPVAAPAAPAVVEEEKVEETEEPKVEEPQKEEEEAPAEHASEEQSSEQEEEGSEEESEEQEQIELPKDILETVKVEGESISVRPLTIAQYDTYTKAELLKFLRAVAPSLPEDVASVIESKAAEKENKKTLLELIDAYIVTDN